MSFCPRWPCSGLCRRFLVDVDVQADGFLHGEALCDKRGLEVHILRRDLRHLQGHQGLKEFITMEADEGGR